MHHHGMGMGQGGTGQESRTKFVVWHLLEEKEPGSQVEFQGAYLQ